MDILDLTPKIAGKVESRNRPNAISWVVDTWITAWL